MTRKHVSSKEIKDKLHEADVLIAQGRTVTQACSTGPKTEAGQARSRMNALKHGAKRGN